jgi:DNA polymerase-3 subunit gamma/tau
MAHAQRLLPIEQLLSDVAQAAPTQRVSSPSSPPSRGIADQRRTAAEPARTSYASPFAADSARKSRTEMSAENAGGPRLVSTPSARVVMGAAAPATAVEEPATAELAGQSPASFAGSSVDLGSVRDAVLNAIGGQRMLASMLETGEWSIEGNELVIKVASSPTVIDMSLGADARRIIIATASDSLGRPIKLKVLPGGTPQAAAPSRTSSNGSGRGRAEQEPVVKRLQEKFGAEIRTIIDYRDKH